MSVIGKAVSITGRMLPASMDWASSAIRSADGLLLKSVTRRSEAAARSPVLVMDVMMRSGSKASAIMCPRRAL